MYTATFRSHLPKPRILPYPSVVFASLTGSADLKLFREYGCRQPVRLRWLCSPCTVVPHPLYTQDLGSFLRLVGRPVPQAPTRLSPFSRYSNRETPVPHGTAHPQMAGYDFPGTTSSSIRRLPASLTGNFFGIIQCEYSLPANVLVEISTGVCFSPRLPSCACIDAQERKESVAYPI
jgi:hypothetical protein